MGRDAYASYEQYEAVLGALYRLQITTDTLKRLIRLDHDLTNALDILEAVGIGASSCRICAERLSLAEELCDYMKANLVQQIGWLGRRQFFELQCLCSFGEDLINRKNFLYESEAADLLDVLDQYDPTVAVDAEDMADQALYISIGEVVDLMERRHKISENYMDFIKSGHGMSEEPLREERLEDSNAI